MAYQQGDLVRCAGLFETSAGVATDPTTVKVTVVRPDDQRQTYTYVTDAVVVKDSTGNYHIDVSAVVPGTWIYWWHSEGTGQAADEKTFIVEAAAAADAPGEPQSLGIDYTQLQRAVGRMLGLGRYPGTWQPNERADVHDIIRAGLRRFYWPPPLPLPEGGEGQVVHLSAKSLSERPTWSWSFMQPTVTLATVIDTTTYDLPTDFGELLEGGFTFTTSQQPVAIVTNEQILQMQSQASRTGVPKYASVNVRDAKLTQYTVTFYPTPDAAYTLSYCYSVTPNDLTKGSPFPLGGPQHAETILEACLAAAEKTLNDEEGLHEKKFLECLTRSIQADANLKRTTEDPWPLEDKALGLGITKAYLKRLIGRQLDFGPHSATWNHRQASEVDLALETGLRKAYAPMILPGERYSHEWSWLRPIGKIVTNSDVYTYDLPSGFVTLEGPLTFAPDEGGLWPSVEIVPEYRVRQKLQGSISTGRPRIGAIREKDLNPAGGSGQEIVFWPPPDDDYVLSFRYHVNPAAMANDACLPYGGPQHAQTIIEACLAAAEESVGTVNGPHAAKFLECLQASVSLDRRAGCPDTLGYNRDNSDRPIDDFPFDSRHGCGDNVVTYGGVEY